MTIVALIVTALLCGCASFAIITGVARPIGRTTLVVNRLTSWRSRHLHRQRQGSLNFDTAARSPSCASAGGGAPLPVTFLP
jgi:hypothetical protein